MEDLEHILNKLNNGENPTPPKQKPMWDDIELLEILLRFALGGLMVFSVLLVVLVMFL